MPSAAYFRRRADLLVARLANIDGDPVESRRYRRMALDCSAKARELDLDEFQLRVMPVTKECTPPVGIWKRKIGEAKLTR
jgi:hypothetical protein